MKTLKTSLVGVGASLLLAAVGFAQLPAQPFTIPADGDYGVYAVQDQSVGPSDPFLAKAYDNFTLTTAYDIDGISWAGIYAEPLPVSPSETDFLIEIWSNDGGVPDLGSGPLVTLALDGGTAGTSGPEVTVTALGHTSPSTNFTPGGGPAFLYDADITPLTLNAGSYWISILGNQAFDNVAPIVDPEWQWHRGTGPQDGFYAFDRLLDPVGTPEFGFLQENLDLAFELRGTIVPEPSSILMLLCVLVPLGVCRRKQRNTNR